MTQKQKIDLLMIVLFVFLLIVAVLMGVRFIMGVKIIQESEQKISQFQTDLNKQSEPAITSPVFKTSDPSLGSISAENVIFIFSGFTCSYCKQQAEILRQLYDKYDKKVFIIWKDLVSEPDLKAKGAALAARCSQNQNSFWSYHDYLFANQDNLSNETFLTIAQEVKLDLNKFNQCLSSQEPLDLINSDMAEAGALKIDASPFMFVNGRPISGIASLEELETLLKLK